jgi:HEAT repeat protein
VNARTHRRPAWRPVVLTAGLLAGGGCAAFLDDVTSSDFSVNKLFDRPSPLIVLRDSTDGDERAKALRALREPLRYGGDQRDQDAVVAVLTTAAVDDHQIVCRMAAISSLRTFKDPRAADALKEAYYATGKLSNAETAAILRCQALEALGETGQPSGVELLVHVVRQPPAEGAAQDRQHQTDERIAAARALGHFKHYRAAEALVEVLRTDQDVALRDKANESLKQITGKDLPPDADAWAEVLHHENADGMVRSESKGFSLFPVGWWK